MCIRDSVITVPDALMQYTMPRSVLESGTVRLARGERVDVAALTARLAAMGYTRCELVEGAGQFSLRGGILDVFSPGSAYPCRVDFFGDEIDLLGYFDTVSQRRYENTTEYLCIQMGIRDRSYTASKEPNADYADVLSA